MTENEPGEEKIPCPHTEAWKFGFVYTPKGKIQRYKCKTCYRTFQGDFVKEPVQEESPPGEVPEEEQKTVEGEE